MENYKAILLQQFEGLKKDYISAVDEINRIQDVLNGWKRTKSLATKEMRAIEKKLAKL